MVETATRLAVLPRSGPPASREVRASVIIVNYNGGEELLACLGSVLSRTPADCEVLVVDNASSDGSAAAVEAEFPAVTLIRSGVNLGFGGGNNLGARQARGRYLVFLNPDTRVEDGWLDALLAPFESDPEVRLVTSRILMAGAPDRINTCGNAVHLTGLALCRGLGQGRDTLGECGEVDAVSGAAFAVPRAAFEALGGFDEDTFLYMEDTDLSWRARLAGGRCRYAPDSVVLHHYRLKITPRKVFYQERNRYLMLLKNLKWATLLLLLPSLLLAEVVTWGFVLWRDRANRGNKLRAYRWVLANWPAILRKRKAVQSLRRVPDRTLLRHTTYRLDLGQVGGGALVCLARLILDPLFFVLRSATLALLWW